MNFAHQADPRAELYYNDYSVENTSKGKGAIALIKKLQARGIPIEAVGLQGHYTLDSPTAAELDAAILDFAGLGIKVMITELDVNVLPAASPNQGADINERSEFRNEPLC
jgi:endo-1,4-beta-xylanase